MDRWIEDFESGGVYWDRDAKELVKVTNGHCTKPHDDTYDGHMSDGRGCLYAPSEGVVLRVVGVTHNGDPVIAWTYRKVKAESLSREAGLPAESPSEDPMTLLAKVRRSRKIGRV